MSDQSAGIGHNVSPDYAATITAQLEKDYAELLSNSAALLDEARAMPKEVTEENQLTSFASLIDRLRDTAARFLTFHVSEKEPHLRAGQAVDTFFFRNAEKLQRRNKKDNPGAADILHARVDAFMQAKLLREREAREEAARKAREEEDRIAAAAAKAAQQAVDDAAAAARARKPENVAALQTSAADNKAAAQALLAQLNQASSKADDARIDTLAKPADMVRTRTEGGQLITMKQVPFVALEDRTKLDMAELWPHLKDEHILMALKAWARTKDHKTPMAGAVIKMVDETVV
jgi:hypothetical protein